MAFCTNCGHEVPENVRFCANCGAAIEINNNDKNENYTKVESLPEEPPRKKWIDKFSKFFGVLLMIVAFIDFQTNPPALTVVLSVAIIVGAVFCLGQKYKLKAFTIIALILAALCLLTSINRGKRLGFFKLSDKSDYKNSSTEVMVDEEPVVEEEIPEEIIAAKEPDKEVTVEAEEKTDTENAAATEGTSEADSVEEVEESTDTETIDEAKEDEADEVDPELKEFLDSYEEFVDEYVEFMKKYTADPQNAISMISEYTSIMKKYSDFAEKVDKYDSDTMSTADAKYYLEVTNRCAQKMLDIY